MGEWDMSNPVTTLYAQWKQSTYTVKFNGNGSDGGGSMTDQTFTCGVDQTLPQNTFTRTGYTFAGWNEQQTGGAIYNDGGTVRDLAAAGGTVTLYAQWTATKYNITYTNMAGASMAGSYSVSYTVEQLPVTLSPATNKTGYTFVGWHDGTQVITEIAQGTTGDIILTAQWEYQLRDSVQVLAGYSSPNHTDGNWKYVEFGYWPQTVKAADVTVDKSTSKSMGMFTYYLGSDGNWYVEQAGQGGTTTKWFKVEPIVWRVLTENYNGKALLLAEKILTGGIQWDDDKNNYMESNIRKWLNGNSVTGGAASDYASSSGFLQTAFTTSAQNLIAETTVDNSAASTNTESSPSQWNGGTNQYACGDTTDKVFLLSMKEATTSGYGFDTYNEYDSTRIRVATDYAQATGADQHPTAGYGGKWWVRSPGYNYEYYLHTITNDGGADYYTLVYGTSYGVVPALCVQLP